LKLAASLLERTQVYRLWQAPFAEDKFAPVLARNDMQRVQRVLDVGCGPGTNARHFANASYTGIDCNPSYVAYARRHHAGNFVVADATTYRVETGERFDFILVNSFLHHIDAPDARRVLSHLSPLLTEDGHIHILELILPEKRSIGRLVARLDRGDFPRSLDQWLKIVKEAFEPVLVEPYTLTAFGITLWNMVYFKCRIKT